VTLIVTSEKYVHPLYLE